MWTIITEGATEKCERKREELLDEIEALAEEIEAQQETEDDEDEYFDIFEAAINGDLEDLPDRETLEGLGRVLEAKMRLKDAQGRS